MEAFAIRVGEDEVRDKVVKLMKKCMEESEKYGKETGFMVCRGEGEYLILPPEKKGYDEVELPSCPEGYEPVLTFHTHTSSCSDEPTITDIYSMLDTKAKMCIGRGGKVTCYLPEGEIDIEEIRERAERFLKVKEEVKSLIDRINEILGGAEYEKDEALRDFSELLDKLKEYREVSNIDDLKDKLRKEVYEIG